MTKNMIHQMYLFHLKIFDFKLAFWTYLAVLGIHFTYAGWVIQRRRFSLEFGSIRSPKLILGLLLLLNGFSLSVFFSESAYWCFFNLGFHVILALDEAVRMYKISARWPFLLNHLLFAGLIGIYGWNQGFVAS